MHSLFDSKHNVKVHHDLQNLHHKVFNISVVGLSGTEKEKGPIGIGKSCLCNRFIRSSVDDYRTDHISVLSQSDYNSRVVNNDHWLYWGSVITSCDGIDLAFNVIEQTEFVDDSCFKPFKSGKFEPYHKRCTYTKLNSSEKLMYICKDQLGIEKEYEQRYLPDGTFNVDGFLCLFDVSEVQGRDIEKQIEIVNLILVNLSKSKKPVVLVTTKHDEACELYIAKALSIVNQREYRGLIPIVETSSSENVNVRAAFLTCAQLIDRIKTKLRILPYFEARKNQRELLRAVNDAYNALIKSTVIDWRDSWQQVCVKLSHNQEFLQFTYLHGHDKAHSIYKNYTKLLKRQCIDQKVQIFMKLLPDILTELVVSYNEADSDSESKLNLSDCSIQNWDAIKDRLRSHVKYETYFVMLEPGLCWIDTDLLSNTDARIPCDWLESNEAYLVFSEWTKQYENEEKIQYAKAVFMSKLEEARITVGKPFVELKYLFNDNYECEMLSDQDLFDVYVEYQNQLLHKARADFLELLLENAEHLHHFNTSDKVLKEEDIKTINTILQHDERYQALDRFEQDRTIMIIRHLSFLQSQASHQCPSYPDCLEPEIERILITRAKSIVDKHYSIKGNHDRSDYQSNSIDLMILGPRRPSQQLLLALNVLSRNDKGPQSHITFTVCDSLSQIEAQIHRYHQSEVSSKGCLSIFTNDRSLEHMSKSLESFIQLDSKHRQKDSYKHEETPVVILYAADITLDENSMLRIENEGQKIADRFNYPFINVTAIDQYRQHQQSCMLNESDDQNLVVSECASLDYSCVDGAFKVLKEAISRKVCFQVLLSNPDLIPKQAANPDIRILLCMLCGEPFKIESFFKTLLLNSIDCYVLTTRSICIRMRTDNGEFKFIEIITSSYTHGANSHSSDLLHGFILVCSLARLASVATLKSFSYNILYTPVQVLAIEDCDNDNNISIEMKNELILEVQEVSRRLKGNYEQISLNRTDQSICKFAKIKPFIELVLKRKATIEKAYDIDETKLSETKDIRFDDNNVANPKPVPGKLDLKQFDNITNAIKKLNVQSAPAIKPPDVSTKKFSLSIQDRLKKNNKKVKQQKDFGCDISQEKKVDHTPATALPCSNSRKPSATSIESKSKALQSIVKQATVDDNNYHDDSIKPKKQPPKVQSLIGDGEIKVVTKSANEGQPKPAPRSVAGPQQTINTSTFTNQVSKRVSRQNHGIAVASPQLPSGNILGKLANRNDNPTAESEAMNTVADCLDKFRSRQSSLDHNSSPISQRFLKNSSNYKVSEISSPTKTLNDSPFMDRYAKNFDGQEGFKRPEPNDLMTTRSETIRQLNEILSSNKGLIRQSSDLHTRKASYELTNNIGSLTYKNDKKDKKLAKDDEKIERRRLKEEEKQRKLEKKLAAKKLKNSGDKCNLFDEDGIPLFIKRCVEFIEIEGLDIEGIYRVPGNRAHVDLFVQKFEDDPNMSISVSDIPVNAVATALKDFLSKKTGPIIPLDLMNELGEISTIAREEDRIRAIRQLVHQLPNSNYKLLKYVFAHFVKVTENFSLNSMDSKNLAICWWPTILPLHFTDMLMFEQMRPHLESSTQALIDKFDVIFDTAEP